MKKTRLTEAFIIREKAEGPIMAVVDKISHIAPDFVGDSDQARELIMALVDQAGCSVQDQGKIAAILGVSVKPEPQGGDDSKKKKGDLDLNSASVNEDGFGGYSLEDAMELDDITPQEAKKEIEKHDAEWADFERDVGKKPQYTGEEILTWLGY
jgi:hypothetical protein